MNSIRYFLALLLVISLPAMLVFWLLIHPFIHAWRRLGPAWTYSIVGTLVMLTMFGLFQARAPLLTVEFGSHTPLWVLGSGCLAIAVYLRRWPHGARLTLCVLIGLPELAPDRHSQAPTDREGLTVTHSSSHPTPTPSRHS